jgi:hypothetical protein
MTINLTDQQIWDCIRAPKGTAKWCRGVRAMAQQEIQQARSSARSMQQLLRMMRENDFYRLMEDVNRQPFRTWEDFVQYREPWGGCAAG